MNDRPALSDDVTLTLSLHQAELLSQLLQDASDNLDLVDKVVLQTLEERLANAHAIAQWLGENVRVDVPRAEASRMHALLSRRRRAAAEHDPLHPVFVQLG